MCGIVGMYGRLPGPPASLQMACAALNHRGLDDSGVWVDEAAGVSLGHTRLSILDLSPAGHQPMASAWGRFILEVNGENYNHVDLRKKVESSQVCHWRGHSDTETLLACISAWGFEQTLRSTVGMFALGIWDRHEQKLLLARDRMGEKPLYYGYAGKAFVF